MTLDETVAALAQMLRRKAELLRVSGASAYALGCAQAYDDAAGLMVETIVRQAGPVGAPQLNPDLSVRCPHCDATLYHITPAAHRPVDLERT